MPRQGRWLSFCVVLPLALIAATGDDVQYSVSRMRPSIARQKRPEKYENLQVRVAGWNVRWIDIPRKEQDDFIRRAESVGR